MPDRLDPEIQQRLETLEREAIERASDPVVAARIHEAALRIQNRKAFDDARPVEELIKEIESARGS